MLLPQSEIAMLMKYYKEHMQAKHISAEDQAILKLENALQVVSLCILHLFSMLFHSGPCDCAGLTLGRRRFSMLFQRTEFSLITLCMSEVRDVVILGIVVGQTS
ncbi:hypothetical protein TELCIR_15983 [Teladorsagia circumcincta]|uniref:Uncharacterized protein n=1 Tax=Teladorsagia circumcincta TaxID=45464 RepID=A0A2G9TX10_TELCI|nr:hypothetical protein TELCIR_15983 [Teladorsagia circumcincta]